MQKWWWIYLWTNSGAEVMSRLQPAPIREFPWFQIVFRCVDVWCKTFICFSLLISCPVNMISCLLARGSMPRKSKYIIKSTLSTYGQKRPIRYVSLTLVKRSLGQLSSKAKVPRAKEALKGLQKRFHSSLSVVVTTQGSHRNQFLRVQNAPRYATNY